MTNKEYNDALDDAISVIQEARECGEGDLRQIIHWIQELRKEDK